MQYIIESIRFCRIVTEHPTSITISRCEEYVATGRLIAVLDEYNNCTYFYTSTEKTIKILEAKDVGDIVGIPAYTTMLSLPEIVQSIVNVIIVPNISYDSDEHIWVYNTEVNVPAANAGTQSTWTITNGRLPSGVNLDSSTGLIYGYPTEESYDYTSATIHAENLSGSDEVTITWVTPKLPSISYTESPFTWAYGSTINTSPTNIGGQAQDWQITSGSLPAGINLDSDDGTISGVLAQQGDGSAVITATNIGGTGSTTVIWSAGTAPLISYSGSPFTWTENVAITPAVPTNTGGIITSYSIVSGSLPPGVTINTSTGEISGTPTDT